MAPKLTVGDQVEHKHLSDVKGEVGWVSDDGKEVRVLGFSDTYSHADLAEPKKAKKEKKEKEEKPEGEDEGEETPPETPAVETPPSA